MTKSKYHATVWHSGLAEWKDTISTLPGRAFLSVVFTWDLPAAHQRAAFLDTMGYEVYAGGPAVALNPDYLKPLAHVNGHQIDALPHHNPQATFTSRGCIRRCKFCAVPKIEGELTELLDWEPRPIVCDNNLLACSRAHFDKVIDSLKPVRGVDFNQGLDARLLTKYHAQRLAELKLHKVRLAWDHVCNEQVVYDAIQTLRKAGIGKKAIKVYVLIGFDDTPQDAYYRLNTLKFGWGIDPNPMRYLPLDAMEKNSYVAPGWTDRQLRNLVRYFSRTRYLGAIPFDEYMRAPADKPWLRRDVA